MQGHLLLTWPVVFKAHAAEEYQSCNFQVASNYISSSLSALIRYMIEAN